MRIPLHTLEIDRYVKWYYNLSVDISCMPLAKNTMNRYYKASMYLHQRTLFNDSNIQSLKLKSIFLQEGKKIEKSINELTVYTDEQLNSSWYLPTLAEWENIKYLRLTSFEHDVEEYNLSIKRTPLPEIEFAKLRLITIEKEKYPKWIEAAKHGHPIFKTSLSLVDLSIGLGAIDFAKYLQNRICEIEDCKIESKNEINIENITWLGKSVELYTLFSDLKEMQLIRGSNADIARIICTNFRDRTGKPLTFSNVQVKLNGDGRSKKRANFSDWN